MREELNQNRTPILEGLKEYIAKDTLPFHVPGHKQGRGLEEFREFVGEQVMAIDLTCFQGTDNICNPLAEIKEAQELAATAYGADHAYFLTNGTTSGIQAMIMSVCRPGDKIILPRNAHKSAIGGIILSGAVPIYIQPEVCTRNGIALAITPQKVAEALKKHPDAKGVFVVNPTYYGFTANLKSIVQLAHNYEIPVLVDEAHGAHLPFHPELPFSAMEAGADIAATSTHKMGGSMTQSSILLLKEGLISPNRVKSMLNLSQTTSPSYVLLASIDVARKQMYFKGQDMLTKTLSLVKEARNELSSVPGLRVVGSELVGKPGCYDWDPTKLTINVDGLGLSGFEVETLLRQKYGIQVELADLHNILLLFSIGDDQETKDRLVAAIKDIALGRMVKNVIKLTVHMPESDLPDLVASPQEAFYSDTKRVRFEDSVDEIAAEMIMAYPPGIPILCPGERITPEIVKYVEILKKEHCHLQGPEDPYIDYIRVLARHLVVLKPDSRSESAG